VNAGQRLARVVTTLVVARPSLWPLLRSLMRRQFDDLAPVWDARRAADTFAPVEAALSALEQPPARALDIGTGTGGVAHLVAVRFPNADVTGIDVAPQMVAEARRLHPGLRFEVADAQRLPFADRSFDLVTLGNAIPFFDELTRVTTQDGWVVVAFSLGPQTPIYVPQERLRRELETRGFADFAEFSSGRGTAVAARRR